LQSDGTVKSADGKKLGSIESNGDGLFCFLFVGQFVKEMNLNNLFNIFFYVLKYYNDKQKATSAKFLF
jgi:hypothetical protein